MNNLIIHLNEYAEAALPFVWSMFWQSSLLIVVVFFLNILLKRKIRASVRYALWLVVLVKLLLPPGFTLPTSAMWWVCPAKPVTQPAAVKNYSVTLGDVVTAPQQDLLALLPPREASAPALNVAGFVLVGTGTVSLALFLWSGFRWWQVRRVVGKASEAVSLAGVLEMAKTRAGFLSTIRLKTVDEQVSPAVCGLFHPVILLPRSLADNLSETRLCTILVHEIVHLRRRDVWVNCAQALLQMVYWWHPLLWVANGCIRRVREEAVDDAVMLAMRDDSSEYAPTLLEVARLALPRPLLNLGLVGMLETRSALRQRIERLVDFHPPRHAGLTLISLGGILAFSAVAVPMGEPPPLVENPTASEASVAAEQPRTVKSVLSAETISNAPHFKERLATILKHADPNKDVEPSGDATNQLISRVFVVDSRAFLWSLKEAGADFDARNNSPARLSAAIRTFFAGLGVDMDSPHGKSLFYNDTNGLLFVRATEDDLALIERAVQALNTRPPQIHIKARFIYVPKGSTTSLDSLMNLTNATSGGLTGILSPTNARAVLHSLASRAGAEILAEPEGITISGRQMQMKATELVSVVTNFDLQQPQNGASSITPQVGQVETGPILDVIPYVLADGYTINLTIIPSLTEFMGYDTPPPDGKYHMNYYGIEVPTVLPRFSTREVTTTLNLMDGQTVVVSGIPESDHWDFSPNGNDSKPNAKLVKNDRELLVLITATIVDSAGNRVHSDDELPHYQAGVPPQPGTR